MTTRGTIFDDDVVALVTNDDGIESDGLVALARALELAGAQVVVAAPMKNMSGASAAMGPIGSTVRFTRHELAGVAGRCYAIEAPPAMIVIAAVNGALGVQPTCVASGVNCGVNLGRAILHSGTVGAALTGLNLGLTSVAVSLESGTNWDVAAQAGVDVLHSMLGHEHPLVANVNVPTDVTASSALCRTRLARFGSVTAAMEDGELAFKMVIDARELGGDGTDAAALSRGDISVTMLSGVGGIAEHDTHLDLRRVDSSV